MDYHQDTSKEKNKQYKRINTRYQHPPRDGFWWFSNIKASKKQPNQSVLVYIFSVAPSGEGLQRASSRDLREEFQLEWPLATSLPAMKMKLNALRDRQERKKSDSRVGSIGLVGELILLGEVGFGLFWKMFCCLFCFAWSCLGLYRLLYFRNGRKALLSLTSPSKGVSPGF